MTFRLGVGILLLSVSLAASQAIFFEPNRGQAAPNIQFLAHANRGLLLLSPDAAILNLPGARISLTPAHANPNSQLVAEDPADGVSHYLHGNKRIANVPHFRRVR